MNEKERKIVKKFERLYLKDFNNEKIINEDRLSYIECALITNLIEKLQKENEELKEIYRSEKKMKNEYVKLYQDLLLKENVIPIQKIKDKIEDLKMSGGSDGKDNIENTARELVIEVLQDILDESKEK